MRLVVWYPQRNATIATLGLSCGTAPNTVNTNWAVYRSRRKEKNESASPYLAAALRLVNMNCKYICFPDIAQRDNMVIFGCI